MHGAEFLARGAPDLAVHGDTGRCRAGVLCHGPVGGQIQLSKDRGEIHIAEFWMQQDIAGQGAGPNAGDFRVQFQALQRHAGTFFVVHVGRAIDCRCLVLAFDKKGRAIGNGIGPRFSGTEIAHGLCRYRPGALGLTADAKGDYRFNLWHDVRWTMAGRCDSFQCVQIGDARRQGALPQAIIQDRFFRFPCVEFRRVGHVVVPHIARQSYGGSRALER